MATTTSKDKGDKATVTTSDCDMEITVKHAKRQNRWQKGTMTSLHGLIKRLTDWKNKQRNRRKGFGQEPQFLFLCNSIVFFQKAIIVVGLFSKTAPFYICLLPFVPCYIMFPSFIFCFMFILFSNPSPFQTQMASIFCFVVFDNTFVVPISGVQQNNVLTTPFFKIGKS